MELEEIYETIDNVKGHIYKITCKENNKIYIEPTYYQNALNFLEKLKLQNNVEVKMNRMSESEIGYPQPSP